MRESPWLRGGLLVLAAGLAVYGLASQWPQVHADLAKLAAYDVVAAIVCVIAGLGCMMLAWRAPLAVACLHPRVIKFGLDLMLKVARQEPLERTVSAGGMTRALAWTVLGWLWFGAHAWFLISVFAGRGGHVAALSLGGYALAWAV